MEIKILQLQEEIENLYKIYEELEEYNELYFSEKIMKIITNLEDLECLCNLHWIPDNQMKNLIKNRG